MDGKTFILASTLVGTGIGYLTGWSFDKKVNSGFNRFINNLTGSKEANVLAISTLSGGIIGLSVSVAYVCIELYAKALFSVGKWVIQSSVEHPIISSVALGILLIGSVAIVNDLESKKRLSHIRR